MPSLANLTSSLSLSSSKKTPSSLKVDTSATLRRITTLSHTATTANAPNDKRRYPLPMSQGRASELNEILGDTRASSKGPPHIVNGRIWKDAEEEIEYKGLLNSPTTYRRGSASSEEEGGEGSSGWKSFSGNDPRIPQHARPIPQNRHERSTHRARSDTISPLPLPPSHHDFAVPALTSSRAPTHDRPSSSGRRPRPSPPHSHPSHSASSHTLLPPPPQHSLYPHVDHSHPARPTYNKPLMSDPAHAKAEFLSTSFVPCT